MGCSVGKVSQSLKKSPMTVEQSQEAVGRPVIISKLVLRSESLAQSLKSLKGKNIKGRPSSPKTNQRAIKRSMSRLSSNKMPRSPKSIINDVEESPRAEKKRRSIGKDYSVSGRSYRISNSCSYKLDATDGNKLGKPRMFEAELPEFDKLATPKKSHFTRMLLTSPLNPSAKRQTKLSGFSQVDQSTLTQNRIVAENHSPSAKVNLSPNSSRKEIDQFERIELFKLSERRSKVNRTEGPASVPVKQTLPRRAQSPKARFTKKDSVVVEHDDSQLEKVPNKFKIKRSARKESGTNGVEGIPSSREKGAKINPVSNDKKAVLVSSTSNGCHIVKKKRQKINTMKENTPDEVSAERRNRQNVSQRSLAVRQRLLIDPIPVQDESSSTSLIEEFIAPKVDRRPSACSFDI